MQPSHRSGRGHRDGDAIGGVLVLFHRPTARRFEDASTIWEHLRAFRRHSRFPVWECNTARGWKSGFRTLDFDAVVLHYSLFGQGFYRLGKLWEEWLHSSRAHKTAFFQDEHVAVGKRHQFLEDHRIDCVFTCVDPSDFAATYGRAAYVPRLETNLPGYVSDEMISAANRFALPDSLRDIDVGYRGRPLPPYMGRGAAEKTEIASRFADAAASSGLVLDIDSTESGRMYGDDWSRFLRRCRAVLGVESGVSVFDVDDVVYPAYLERVRDNPALTAADLSDVLERYEGLVTYRTLSPRHLEAAAFRCVQVMYEGRYSDQMRPMEHYIPLKKDFSNVDGVIAALRDAGLMSSIAARAHRDLIASGDLSYSRLIDRYDAVLLDAGVPIRAHPLDRARFDAAARGPIVERAARRARSEVIHAVDRVYVATPAPIVEALAAVRYRRRPRWRAPVR